MNEFHINIYLQGNKYSRRSPLLLQQIELKVILSDQNMGKI